MYIKVIQWLCQRYVIVQLPDSSLYLLIYFCIKEPVLHRFSFLPVSPAQLYRNYYSYKKHLKLNNTNYFIH